MYLANICFLLPAKIVVKEHLAAPAVPPHARFSRRQLMERMFHGRNTGPLHARLRLNCIVSETSASGRPGYQKPGGKLRSTSAVAAVSGLTFATRLPQAAKRTSNPKTPLES
jgi:hypothetical protein